MQTVRLTWTNSENKSFIRNENGGLTTSFKLSLLVSVTVLVASAIAVPLTVLNSTNRVDEDTQFENSTGMVTSSVGVTDQISDDTTTRKPLSFGPSLETISDTAITVTARPMTNQTEPLTEPSIDPQTDDPNTNGPTNPSTNPTTNPPTDRPTQAPSACDANPCNNNGVCTDDNSPTAR